MYFGKQIDEGNRKIDKVKKNIMHDILLYNLSAANQKRKRKIDELRINKQQHAYIINKEQEYIRKQQRLKRSNIIYRRNILKEEYQRDIKYKIDRKSKQKQQNKHYAQMQKYNQQYNDERRFYQLQRIYRKKKYNAVQVQQNKRMKSEPNVYELGIRKYNKQSQVYKSFDDSLDIQINKQKIKGNPQNNSPYLQFKNFQFN